MESVPTLSAYVKHAMNCACAAAICQCYNQRMFKIGDFSQRGQVSIRTLRLYDEMDLLNPTRIKHIVIEAQIPIATLDAPR